MKIIALDIGDRWTGIAISDPAHIIATPYKTVKTGDLSEAIELIEKQENIGTVVVGLAITLRGRDSDQTRKIRGLFQALEEQFAHLQWKWWDERFTSSQAAAIKPIKTKEDKLQSHSIAAALILSGYLESQRFAASLQEDQSDY